VPWLTHAGTERNLGDRLEKRWASDVAKQKFAVVITRPAEQDLGRLDRQIAERIDPILLALENDPTPFGCTALTGPQKGYHRIRVGDYRIVYRIDYTRFLVSVTKIANRKDVYR
jgi:mRNA interferase RelE/StbE